MKKCIKCKKELPSNAKVPLCEHCKSKAKEAGGVALAGVSTAVVFVKQLAPKVAPVIKENAPKAIEIAKRVIK